MYLSLLLLEIHYTTMLDIGTYNCSIAKVNMCFNNFFCINVLLLGLYLTPN